MSKLIQIPAWRDNYIYLLVEGDEALVVDPTASGPVMETLEREGLTLKAILNTHHHPDHVGGNAELVEATSCEVYGPEHDQARIPKITKPVAIGEEVTVVGLRFRVLDVRAHTRGHICFALDAPVSEVVRHGHDHEGAAVDRLARRPVLFVGDSLFLAGCGRLFEGDPAQLEASMEVYRRESPEALVCCAHEYTEANLRFAEHVLPGHTKIAERLASLDEERAASGSSVPDTLARELETNPYLLALDERFAPELAERLEVDSTNPTALVGALRAAKDAF